MDNITNGTIASSSSAASPQETVPVLQAIDLPIHLLLAALTCASDEDTRYYLNGVFLHAVEGSVRIVATDGHRLFVGATKVEGELPAWLEKGVTVPREHLKARLSMIGKMQPEEFQSARVSYAVGAPRMEISNFDQEVLFRPRPVDGAFPDYSKVMGLGIDTEEPGTGFEKVGFNADYIKAIGEVSKVLGSQSVTCWGRSQKDPALFTFDSCPGAVLYLMPMATKKMTVETTAVLAPAIKATLAALKAHATRNLEAAAAETDEAERGKLAAKAQAFLDRIKAIKAQTSVKALPAPKPETPAPDVQPEAKVETPAPSYAIADAVADDKAPVEPPQAPVETPIAKLKAAKAKQKPSGKRPTASALPPKTDRVKRTFETWEAAVSAAVQRQHGVGLSDLPDAPTRDWFDAKISVDTAAKRAIAWAKTF